jgi:hypothetical protein
VLDERASAIGAARRLRARHPHAIAIDLEIDLGIVT